MYVCSDIMEHHSVEQEAMREAFTKLCPELMPEDQQEEEEHTELVFHLSPVTEGCMTSAYTDTSSPAGSLIWYTITLILFGK